MNRAPIFMLLFLLILFLFPDQAPDQREEEERDSDDPRGEPDLRTEITKLFKREIVMILPRQCARVAIYDQTDGKDHNQQEADEDHDSGGVSSFHRCAALPVEELLENPAFVAVVFNPGPFAFFRNDGNHVTELQAADAVHVG